MTDIEIDLAVYDPLGRVVGFYILELGSEVTLQPGEVNPGSVTLSKNLAGDAERFLTFLKGALLILLIHHYPAD